jgi:hypothetical protein
VLRRFAARISGGHLACGDSPKAEREALSRRWRQKKFAQPNASAPATGGATRWLVLSRELLVDRACEGLNRQSP